MQPVFIFLDTNNWIYLANGFNVLSSKHDDLHLKIFDIVKKRVEDNSLVFLANDIVIQEFDRNKSHTEAKNKQIQDKANSYRNTLNVVKDWLPEDSANIEQLRRKIQQKAREKIAEQTAHIAEVEGLLKTKTTLIPISPEIYIEASKMAVDKKAPFIGEKKNSMADALLLLSSVKYLYETQQNKIDNPWGDKETFIYFPISYFVSSNSGDFSDTQNKEKIHPDLEPILKRSETKFYHNLYPLIDSLEKNLLTKEEAETIEAADRRISCGVCDHEHSELYFLESIRLFDPHLLSSVTDPNQIELFETPVQNVEKAMIDVRIAECSHCGSNFLKCPNCGDFVHMNTCNVKTSCTCCHYCFILHAEKDRKGIVYMQEYEIIQEFSCVQCGEKVESINANGKCSSCAEYDNVIEES